MLASSAPVLRKQLGTDSRYSQGQRHRHDANDWAMETMKNARYPLELFQRVITVSLRTMEIVRGLPGL